VKIATSFTKASLLSGSSPASAVQEHELGLQDERAAPERGDALDQ